MYLTDDTSKTPPYCYITNEFQYGYGCPAFNYKNLMPTYSVLYDAVSKTRRDSAFQHYTKRRVTCDKKGLNALAVQAGLDGGTMTAVYSLIPARFLTLTAHLVIVITIFWSRETNVEACLPLEFSPEEFNSKDTELVVALSVTLGLFAVELAGFFSGVSMFNCSQSLLSCAAHVSGAVSLLFFLFEQWPCGLLWWILAFSLAAHCSGAVSLSFFVFQKWECWNYWVIFTFCSALPAVVEVFLFIAVFGLKKKPL
ncbi:hypothetical protein GJAV_G00127990 [Gymnothorax javanicus]|nr:hypothetical protein GJAV_G00127990 [Gymnothorax javanicus]